VRGTGTEANYRRGWQERLDKAVERGGAGFTKRSGRAAAPFVFFDLETTGLSGGAAGTLGGFLRRPAESF